MPIFCPASCFTRAASMSKTFYPQILKSAVHARPPFKQKVSVLLLDTLRAWRAPQQHYGLAALVPNVVVATRTHGHGHVSTHVRWLYNRIRVANAAVLQQAHSRQSQSGLVVSSLLAFGDLVPSQKGTSEHTVKQACLSSCCVVRGGPSSKVFSIVLE